MPNPDAPKDYCPRIEPEEAADDNPVFVTLYAIAVIAIIAALVFAGYLASRDSYQQIVGCIRGVRS